MLIGNGSDRCPLPPESYILHPEIIQGRKATNCCYCCAIANLGRNAILREMKNRMPVGGYSISGLLLFLKKCLCLFSKEAAKLSMGSSQVFGAAVR